MIKAIATDLDGTLFYPKKRLRLLSSKNRKFLKRAIDNGYRVILVSGRNLDIVEKIEKKIDRKVSMIGCNGSVVSFDDKIVFEAALNKEKLAEIYNTYYNDDKIQGWLFMTNKLPLFITINPKLSSFRILLYKLGLKSQGVYNEPFEIGEKYFHEAFNDKDCKIYKMMPFFGYRTRNADVSYEYSLKLQEKYGEDFEILWSHTSIEIMPKGINKAVLLKQLNKTMGIEDDEVAVIGDSGNDVPLFQEFKNSFVMAHAPDMVKQEAKYTIKSVHELEQFLEEGENK